MQSTLTVEEREHLHATLTGLLTERLGQSISNLAITPLSGGACQENFRIDVDTSGSRSIWVLRADAKTSLPGSIGRREEFGVMRLAVEQGVCTPSVFGLTKDLPRLGAHSYLMPWVEGVSIGRRVLREPELESTRASLAPRLAKELAQIHSITPRIGLFVTGMNIDPTAEPSVAALQFTRQMMDTFTEPRPALELAYRWLVEHQPKGEKVVLVHGDFRTGNFMLTPTGLSAVLDWEFSHWGSRYEDFGWLCLREWRFGQTKFPVGGFARRDEFYSAYEGAAGVDVDRNLAHYWEVLGNVRWAAGCVYQGERYRAGQTDLELIAIPRRAAEMEWEALRLIEQGTV